MRTARTITVAVLAYSLLTPPAFAQEYSSGEVTKIDTAQKKLTIKHGELKNLEMPAMTMIFVVAEESMISEVKVGQKIQFKADRINGRITVTDIK